MLTKFGKELRKIRLDRDELLKDMAQKLGITVAYLSAVENGKRKIPGSWLSILSREYQMCDEEVGRLQRLAYAERSQISIDVENAGDEEKDLVFSFARRFGDLSAEDRDEIQKILNRGRGGV